MGSIIFVKFCLLSASGKSSSELKQLFQEPNVGYKLGHTCTTTAGRWLEALTVAAGVPAALKPQSIHFNIALRYRFFSFASASGNRFRDFSEGMPLGN